MNDFIQFLQPLVATMFIIAGAAMLFVTWLGWMMASAIPLKAWIAFAINHASAVVLTLTGFFIAHW